MAHPFQSNSDNELNFEKQFRCDWSQMGTANDLAKPLTGMVGHERHDDCASHRCPPFADLFSFLLRSIEMPQNQTWRLKPSSRGAKGKSVSHHNEIAPSATPLRTDSPPI
jgi:hypothetical protein